MKKLAKKMILYCILLSVILTGGFIGVAKSGKAYDLSFQGMINRQYAHLQETESPKCIYVAGSSGLFGVDTALLEKLTGKRIVNYSLHAALGTGFVTNMIKANIQPGDTVILAYEYKRWYGKPTGDPALIVSAIDDNIELYQYVETGNYIGILKYIPTYCMKKLAIMGGYSEKQDDSALFDENGNYIKWGDECVLPEDISNLRFTLSTTMIDKDMIEYVQDFKDFVEKQGATLVLASPPVLDEGVIIADEDFNKFCQYITEQTGVNWISDPYKHVFKREDMSNTIWHCNRLGKDKNTQQLADDINEYFGKIE